MNLEQILATIAYDIVDNGIESYTRSIEVMASAAQRFAPGAAAALVDRDGTDVAAFRAFGAVSRVLVSDLSSSERDRLVLELQGTDRAVAA